jgi:hypothetical protein
MGHTRPAGPNAMVGGLLDLAICRLLPGVRTRGRTRDGRASGTEPKICTPIIAPDAAGRVPRSGGIEGVVVNLSDVLELVARS